MIIFIPALKYFSLWYAASLFLQAVSVCLLLVRSFVQSCTRSHMHTNTHTHHTIVYKCIDQLVAVCTGSLIPSTEVSSMLRLTKQSSVAVTKTKGLLPARRMMTCDYRVFRIAKGISSVDYCSRNNVIVTGSVDRLVRVWNPFMTTWAAICALTWG